MFSQKFVENKGIVNLESKLTDLDSIRNTLEKKIRLKMGCFVYSIAKKYPGVSISELKKWNDIRGEQIKPGMKLKING